VKYKLVFFLLALLCLPTASNSQSILQSHGKIIRIKELTSAVLLLENEWNSFGTGFLVKRNINSNQRTFLITNKHVLNQKKELRDKAQKIRLYLNTAVNGKLKGIEREMDIISNGTRLWREHPDESVDVLAIDVTNFLKGIPNLSVSYLSSNLDGIIADSEVLDREEITIGDEIIAIGYPRFTDLITYKQGEAYLPIIRQGIIGSQVNLNYIEKIFDNGKVEIKNLRGFLIDGAIIPGSSGSPIFLKPYSPRIIHGRNNMSGTHPYLLGIVSENRYALTKTSPMLISFANIGFVFNSSTILETLDLFLK